MKMKYDKEVDCILWHSCKAILFGFFVKSLKSENDNIICIYLLTFLYFHEQISSKL